LISALDAFKSRIDLEPYDPNGLLLFAIELRFGIDDIASVAATAITDGSDDHKCDLVYIDSDSRTAVIGQAYMAAKATKKSAPSNKAADLSTAASWILGNQRPHLLGASLQAAAQELHESIEVGEIDVIELWYTHNLPESENVRRELERASVAANALVAQHYPGSQLEVRHLEVGRGLLNDWYESTQSPILVADEFDVPADGWFTEGGDGWNAVCTSVPAVWLCDLFARFGDKLFSANVRGYMPSRRSAQNINFGIETTARSNPGHFWAFNNGVTALVHRVVRADTEQLRVSGFAIVNGAQTTGALSRVDREHLAQAKVMIRLVQATDPVLVQDIIRYNNSQNQIKPSDFRSGDRNQKRLRQEFLRIPNSTYLGARRGGPDDRARRPSNLIPSDTSAQALAAFHQDPGVAYHDLRSIWENDETYSRYFSDHTTARHIVFCYSLWRAVTEVKASLSSIGEDKRTAYDQEALDYLRKRGSLHLLVAGVANGMELYLGRAIPDSFALSFSEQVSPDAAVQNWLPLVETLLPFAPDQLGPAFDSGGLRRKDNVASHIARFRAVVASTRRANARVFEDFRERVIAS